VLELSLFGSQAMQKSKKRNGRVYRDPMDS
jgi:hypothetical protein